MKMNPFTIAKNLNFLPLIEVFVQHLQQASDSDTATPPLPTPPGISDQKKPNSPSAMLHKFYPNFDNNNNHSNQEISPLFQEMNRYGPPDITFDVSGELIAA